MKLPYEINTVEKNNEVSTVINKSTFIAQVYPVKTESEAKEFLSEAKKKYYNASHHCYALKFADGYFRYSDAGEPNGTAGIRIFNAIEHFQLSNQLIIVSRIFGGVKLGVGPLGKAYYESAFNVIENSKITNKQLFQRATILTEYEKLNLIQRILANHNSIIIQSDFKEKIKLSCLLQAKNLEAISKKIYKTDKDSANLTLHDDLVYEISATGRN